MLLSVATLCPAAEPAPEVTFPERVRAFLDSPWTEITITTALVTDYGVVHATSVHLIRNTPKAPVHFRLPLNSGEKSKVALTEVDLRTLCASTLQAASETFEHRYPLEIYNSLPREKAIELVESGKLRIGPTDVELLVIRGKNAAGEVTLTETGPCNSLEDTIHKLFQTKQVEVKPSDYEAALGRNPYK